MKIVGTDRAAQLLLLGLTLGIPAVSFAGTPNSKQIQLPCAVCVGQIAN